MKKLKTKTKFNIAKIKPINLFFKPLAKVVEFKPKETGLTDSDITNLFLGLVNLIKQNAISNAENYYRKEINFYMNELKNYALKVVKLENEVNRLTKLK